MSESVYTAITFAPVQGFIEKSRKLRDLYGSSFLLSYLARVIDAVAKQESQKVISPALVNLTQGTPNQLIIRGPHTNTFTESTVRAAFNTAWKEILECCRVAIETKLPQQYSWKRAWNDFANHTWEFFWAQTLPEDADKPDRIGDVRHRLNAKKRSRDWTGINWGGESSTLSGADAIAWPRMAEKPFGSISEQQADIKHFYEQLSNAFSESIIDPKERLSIPELVKRLITLDEVAQQLRLEKSNLPSIEIPSTFSDLNRREENRWTGWFQGDGDGVGKSLQGLTDEALTAFSKAMLNWGKNLRKTLPDSVSQEGYRFIDTDDRKTYLKTGRIIYAGGDDFLGVLYRNDPDPKLTAQECLNWFYGFNNIWKTHKHSITVSVGLVWAAPNIPQRDVLQHCRETEKLAKDSGRDRLAIRILFNGGNTLEWTCPWQYLNVLQDYRDRDGETGTDANWNHIFEDVALLEARHAFRENINVAIALFALYFGEENANILQDNQQLWNHDNRSGLLGDSERFPTPNSQQKALNDWVITLAKVGFHLHRHPANVPSALQLV
jgi:CRISPR-associated protein Cmr2